MHIWFHMDFIWMSLQVHRRILNNVKWFLALTVDNLVSACFFVDSSPPSAPYMCQWVRSALVQIMALSLFGAKPLSRLMLGYGHLEPWKQTLQWNSNRNTKFSFTEMHFKTSAKRQPFCPGGNDFNILPVDIHSLTWLLMAGAVLPDNQKPKQKIVLVVPTPLSHLDFWSNKTLPHLR